MSKRGRQAGGSHDEDAGPSINNASSSSAADVGWQPETEAALRSRLKVFFDGIAHKDFIGITGFMMVDALQGQFTYAFLQKHQALMFKLAGERTEEILEEDAEELAAALKADTKFARDKRMRELLCLTDDERPGFGQGVDPEATGTS